MKLIYELIEAYAAANPSKPAITDPQGRMTYGELAAHSASLACRLISLGVQAGDAAAVYVPFAREILPGAVAVLRAGGIFVPFDDSYPPERLEYMLKDSEAKAILTTRTIWERKPLQFPEERVLFLDDPVNDYAAFTDCETCTEDSPAMLIYTSGTTGNPKGVLHTHRMMLHLADFMKACQGVEMNSDSRSGVMSSFSFMGSEIVLWAPMQKGGTVCIAPETARKDLAVLDAFMRENGITHIFMPSGLAAILAEDYDISRVFVFAGGEKLRNFRPYCPGNCLWNLYGSTEISGVVTKKIYGSEERILVGKPYRTTKALIVDESLKPVPDGEPGEILFTSDYMSRRYWKLPDLTAEKWIELDGKQWFRMGDRAVRTSDGDLDILGRIDNMVKLRGFRIETGEVEDRITRAVEKLGCPGTGQVAVVVKTVGGTDHLTCYYEAPEELDRKAVTDEISKTLAEYMVPDLWVRMDAFPRNANGKVLRKELPQPRQERRTAGILDSEVVARMVWTAAEVLGTDDFISPEDRFTDLGGTSLSALKYSARLREQGIKISGAQVLELNVLRRIADAAEVNYEQLWTPEEFERVQEDFAERGERIRKVLPLTAMQDEMLFDQIIHPDRECFRDVLFLEMDSIISEDDIRGALDRIADENEELRSAVVFHHVSVIQQVITDRRIPLTMIETDSFGSEEMDAMRNRLLYTPIDLQRTSLIQFMGVHAEDKTFLCMMVHRLAFERRRLACCMARLTGLLEEKYPGDASISEWKELFEQGRKPEPEEGQKTRPVPVRKDEPPEICVYSENSGPKMVFIHTGSTGSEAYYQLAARIGDRVSFAVIEPFNLYHTDEAVYGIPNIAAKYIEILKRYQPEGPYLLGGWCYGGMVAHEMACQLERAGEQVRHLYMMDAHAITNKHLRSLSTGMFETVNRDYFERCPLFAEMREKGMLDAMVINAAHVNEDMMKHVPSFFHGDVTYFKPAQVPKEARENSRRYWEEMMKYLAGNYEHYCSRGKLKVVITPHEHDKMMDKASLDIIVPEILRSLSIS